MDYIEQQKILLQAASPVNNIPPRHTLLKVIIAACGIGIVSSFVSPVIAGVITPFLYADFNTAGLVTIVYGLMTAFGVALAFALLAGYISFRLTRKKKDFLLGLLLCIVTTTGIYAVTYTLYTSNEMGNLDQYRKEFAHKQALADSTRIELQEFREQGEFDEKGALKKLDVSIKLTSNNTVTINNPFGIALAEPYPQRPDSEDRICWDILYPSDVADTYMLKPGVNEITTSIPSTSFRSGSYINRAYESALIEPVVYLAFRPHLELNEYADELYGQSNAPDIVNVTNQTGITDIKKCVPREYFPVFKIKKPL